MTDMEKVTNLIRELQRYEPQCTDYFKDVIDAVIELLKEQDDGKYEYHYDHTDCIWYNPEEENERPATCSQYRDGWNDAMDYIFKDGKGYQPYVRG